MIKSITVTNDLGESKKFVLADPQKFGFAISEITGLGPPKASINSSESATHDGSMFNSSRVQERNIVITAYLMFSPTIEDVRLESYKYFPIKRKVKLVVETDTRVCSTIGYVESNEPDIFSKAETIQISIICPDPYFYSEAEKTTVFYGVEPLFEFAFSNESLTEPLIEFGAIQIKKEQTIWYTGDAEVGVVIKMHAIGMVKNIAIYNTRTRQIFKIDTEKLEKMTGSPVVAGDDIIVSTMKGDKYVLLFRNGEYINILNCMSKDSEWFTLRKGDNIFAFDAEYGSESLEFRVYNKTLYEGV